MKAAIIAFTYKGWVISEKIRCTLEALGYRTEISKKGRYFPDSISVSTAQWARQNYEDAKVLVFVGACGIAVRSIAPLVQDKRTDPAVLVADECGSHVISLLSGHLGGANALTLAIAKELKADPVITTATDVQKTFAIDTFASQHNCALFPMSAAKAVSAALLHGEPAGLYSEFLISGELPEGILLCGRDGTAPNGLHPRTGIAITLSEAFRDGKKPFPETVCLVPKILSLGMGCKKGTDKETLHLAAVTFLKESGYCPEALFSLASIDLKKEEPGMKDLSRSLQIPFLTFCADTLSQAEGSFSSSAFVKQVTGVDSVCERSAVCATQHGKLLKGKTIVNGTACALAAKDWIVSFGG